VPYYKSRFRYAGKTYSYTSVGTDPRTSATTTRVPVTLIPLRISVPGGSAGPAGAIKATAGSALFRSSRSTSDTQYGDATLRSSYWAYLRAHRTRWHILLDQPVTRPRTTLRIPATQGTVTGPDGDGLIVLLVNTAWLRRALAKIAAAVNPRRLTMFLTYNTVGCANFNIPRTCQLAGSRGATVNAAGTHTFVWGSWTDPSVFANHMTSLAAMSHEVAGWLNNPFLNDAVPAWHVASEPQYGCSTSLDVGDPVNGVVFKANGLEYQDAANFSWFARQKPSIAYKQRYSYLGTLKTYSASC
jgi:hypothetical protein